MTPQIVLDTNVLFSAVYSRYGSSFALLNQISSGDVGVHVSLPLLVQYEDVLIRNSDKLQMDAPSINAIIDRLCSVSQYHEIYYLWRPYLPDPKDDLVLELAIASRCTHIVTHNLRDFVGAESFGITPISPVEFIHSIGERHDKN